MPFYLFGPSHLYAVGIILALGLALIRAGKKVSAKTLAIVLLVVHIPYQLNAFLPQNFSIHHSIPLQICDLAWVVCTVALWSQSRWSSRLIYFWGLTLIPQALLTPAVKFDFPHFVYLGFWIDHGLVFMCTLYIIFVLKFRPNRRDFLWAYGFTLGWGLFVLSFNSYFGTNYMFLNQKPEKSVLDLFGPWPIYLIVEAFVVGIVWYFILTPRKTNRQKNMQSAAF